MFEIVNVPACSDSLDAQALATALAAHSGKPLVNSVNREETKLEARLRRGPEWD
jgi:cobalamin-dependent methionine synthase I